MALLRSRIFWFLLLLGINILFLISSNTDFTFSRDVIFNATSILRNALGRGGIAITDVKSKMKARKEIKIENEALQQKVLKYEQQLRSVSSLEFENNLLRNILEFSLSITYTLKPAQIIAADGNNNRLEEILVNRGSRYGIQRGMAVVGIYNNELAVLGRISEVSRNTAQFTSINDVDFFIPAQTKRSMQKGILSGDLYKKNILSFATDSIYESESIFVGEKVFVNQYSKFFPRGILIGEVTEILPNPENLMFRIYVKPYLHIEDLEYVFIIIPNNSKTNEKEDSEDLQNNNVSSYIHTIKTKYL